MCSQTVERFFILLRETFSYSIPFTLIDKYVEGALVEILAVFGPVYYAVFRKVFRNETFKTFI